MNFVHYLYVKFENIRGGSRGGISVPISVWLYVLLMPFISEYCGKFWWIMLIAIFILPIGLTYIVLPPKKVHIKTWKEKYENTTSLWAYLYFFGLILSALLVFPHI